MDRSDWVDICASIADLWHDSQMTAKRVGAWFPLLADLDTADVRAAVLALAGSGSPWPPRSPGEIRAAIAADDGWEAALGDLYSAVRRHGAINGIPDGLDPRLVAYVHSAGGWVSLCRRPDGWASDPSSRAQFRDFWKDAADRVERRRAVDSAVAVLGMSGRLAIGRSVDAET